MNKLSILELFCGYYLQHNRDYAMVKAWLRLYAITAGKNLKLKGLLVNIAQCPVQTMRIGLLRNHVSVNNVVRNLNSKMQEMLLDGIALKPVLKEQTRKGHSIGYRIIQKLCPNIIKIVLLKTLAHGKTNTETIETRLSNFLGGGASYAE